MDCAARSPPSRAPACPAAGESTLTLGAMATRFRYCRPFSGSSVTTLFSMTGTERGALVLSRVDSPTTVTVSPSAPTCNGTSTRTVCWMSTLNAGISAVLKPCSSTFSS